VTIAAVQCPVCRSRAEVRGPHGSRQVLRCSASSCRVEFLHPSPTSEELRVLYQTVYYPADGATNGNVYLNTPPQVAEGLVTTLRAHLGGLRGLRVLDFGAGIGELAGLMRAQGSQVECTEPDAEARRQLRLRNLTAWASLDELLETGPGRRFDLVTAIEVVEHLEDPVSYLRQLRRVLSDGGALFLTTPNFGSLRARLMGLRWEQYCNPTHLFYFTYASLACALRQAGFSSVSRVRTLVSYPHHGLARRLLQRSLQRTGLDGDLLVLARRSSGAGGDE